jgi:hypothetical protein
VGGMHRQHEDLISLPKISSKQGKYAENHSTEQCIMIIGMLMRVIESEPNIVYMIKAYFCRNSQDVW